MSVKFKSVLFISSALLLAAPIHANPKMDINGDDEISRIEYMSYKSNSFNKQDKNFDGRLTKQEINNARKEVNRQNIKKRFKDMDKNGDGHVTQTEHDELTNAQTNMVLESSLKGMDEWFNKMDTDNNDHISRLEYSAALKTQFTEQHEKNLERTRKAFTRLDLDNDGIITELEYVDKDRKLVSAKSDPLTGLYAHETAKPKKRTRRDANSDGHITKREDRGYNEYQFDKMDKNKDGVITKKENSFIFGDFKHTVQRLRD